MNLPVPGSVYYGGLFEGDRYVYEDQSLAHCYQEYIDTLMSLFGYPTVPLFHFRGYTKPIPEFIEARTEYDSATWLRTRRMEPAYVFIEAAPFHTPDDILWTLGHEAAHLVQFYRYPEAGPYRPHGEQFVEALADVIQASGAASLQIAPKALAFEIVYSDAPVAAYEMVKSLGLDYLEILRDRWRYRQPFGPIDLPTLYADAMRIISNQTLTTGPQV